MVVQSVENYMKHGLKKSEAVRRTMSDFKYACEASIYGILKRNKEKGGNDDKRTA
ncbi:hypothetical protein [Segatella copri]|uniref:hypothetical protein n=1 Tax=Segatella copri TaxID=165179 RepID=UPI00190DD5B3|nr:hypothetical protein [Segatella copri]